MVPTHLEECQLKEKLWQNLLTDLRKSKKCQKHVGIWQIWYILPETNKSHLKTDAWKTRLSDFGFWPIFRWRLLLVSGTVTFRICFNHCFYFFKSTPTTEVTSTRFFSSSIIPWSEEMHFMNFTMVYLLHLSHKSTIHVGKYAWYSTSPIDPMGHELSWTIDANESTSMIKWHISK